MIFDAASLAKVASAIVPDGKTSAIMGVATKDGAQIIVGLKFGADKQWEVQGQFEHTWAGDNNGQIKVLWSK